MVVADDEAHAVEAPPDEVPDEARPGRALVVARGQLEPEHPALAAHGHARGHEAGHGHHAPGLADLDVGGIEPQVGVCLARERPAPEGLDLGIERGAHPAHLAAADAVDAEGPHQVLGMRRLVPSPVRRGDATHPAWTPVGASAPDRTQHSQHFPRGLSTRTARDGSRPRCCPRSSSLAPAPRPSWKPLSTGSPIRGHPGGQSGPHRNWAAGRHRGRGTGTDRSRAACRYLVMGRSSAAASDVSSGRWRPGSLPRRREWSSVLARGPAIEAGIGRWADIPCAEPRPVPLPHAVDLAPAGRDRQSGEQATLHPLAHPPATDTDRAGAVVDRHELVRELGLRAHMPGSSAGVPCQLRVSRPARIPMEMRGRR